MSRIDYSDEEDFPGQFEIWQANCRRSLRGKRGQAALCELEAALVAMPIQELHDGLYVERSGAVCALGALDVHREMQKGVDREVALSICADRDPEDSQANGEAMGLPSLVAWKVVEMNDIELGSEHCYSAGRDVSPAERYRRMLRWVHEELAVTR